MITIASKPTPDQTAAAGGGGLLLLLQLLAQAAFNLADEADDIGEAALWSQLGCDLSDHACLAAMHLDNITAGASPP